MVMSQKSLETGLLRMVLTIYLYSYWFVTGKNNSQINYQIKWRK